MISNLLEDNAVCFPQKTEKASENNAQINFDLTTYTFPSQVEACIGKIESISNAASTITPVCVDQSVDSITQKQV
jgi:hypothetical protein